MKVDVKPLRTRSRDSNLNPTLIHISVIDIDDGLIRIPQFMSAKLSFEFLKLQIFVKGQQNLLLLFHRSCNKPNLTYSLPGSATPEFSFSHLFHNNLTQSQAALPPM